MASEPNDAAARNRSIAVFGVTILLSAFLLFQIQPLISKAILPWFGGCPAVWTTCLLFFQTLLFGGYLYAHLLQRWLATRSQTVVHLLLVVAALAVLPILPEPSSKPVDSSQPTWHILLLLMATVGLPYFALSATSPLVQAWFSIRCPGRSPYRLYALSNIGSLAALLTYPILFEPAMDLPKQSTLWSSGFALYAILCVALLVSLYGNQSSRRTPCAAADADGARNVPAALSDWIRWLLLPACASLMLVAGTNHICQDVAVVPFLWVLPLTLYLLSFIICFDQPRWYVRWLWAGAAALELVGVAAVDHLKLCEYPLNLVQELTVNCAALFFVCMICHGELARLKPSPRYLTEYYLVIAAGGAMGGLFVGIVAPLIFSTYMEWKIGMVASALLAAGLLILAGPGGRKRWIRYAALAPAAAVGLYYVAYWEFDTRRPLDQARNFFGVVSVTEDDRDAPEKHAFLLKHGRITHGCQFADLAKRRWATSYYGEDSGVGVAIDYLHKSGPIRVGAIGLGVGTVATYAKPGDVFRFYEINPEVLRMARQHFTYLADCRGKCDVVLGDARLSLDAELPQKFNLLVIDAFSGDAIPTHLLTREAFDIYRRHLAPGGLIVVHISNSYLRLAPVVRRLAEDCGMKAARICGAEDKERMLNGNQWMLVTRNEDFLRAHPGRSPDSPDDKLVVPLWTDQYSNLFQILSGGIGGFR